MTVSVHLPLWEMESVSLKLSSGLSGVSLSAHCRLLAGLLKCTLTFQGPLGSFIFSVLNVVTEQVF